MKKLIIKCCLTLLCIFCACGVNLAGNFTTPGFGPTCDEDSPENVTDANEDSTTETDNLSTQNEDDLKSLSELRFYTSCETPNEDPGICVEIRTCPILFKQLRNPKAKNFILASRCDTSNKNWRHPKVCCGKYGDFIDVRPKEFSTPCETPNLDLGLCVEIKKCPILYSQLANVEAREFIRASRCGPDNQDHKNPKVCCGKLNNYQNISNNELSDKNVFPKVCGNQKIIMRGRIIGGKTAALGEFPWMARLIHKNKKGYKSYGCSGFLIHSKYVATAAHCVHHNFTEIRGEVFSVTLGEHDTDTEIDCSPKGTYCADRLQISRVAKVIVHHEYDPTSDGHYNDIALLHLNKGARITEYVKPICLQTDSTMKPHKYTISGWGKTEKEGQSKIKLRVDLKYFEHADCKDKYTMLQISLRDTQLCAGGEKNKDSCSGDSGGPLMMANDSIWYAAGIVSYGVGCGYEGWPGVYTNIPYFIPWIKTQIIRNSLVSSKHNKDKKHKNKNKQQNGNNDTETITITSTTTTETSQI